MSLTAFSATGSHPFCVSVMFSDYLTYAVLAVLTSAMYYGAVLSWKVPCAIPSLIHVKLCNARSSPLLRTLGSFLIPSFSRIHTHAYTHQIYRIDRWARQSGIPTRAKKSFLWGDILAFKDPHKPWKTFDILTKE